MSSLKKIFLGTMSSDKRAILSKALNCKDYEIIAVAVDSMITDQPLDEQTTRQGSVNRAMNAVANIGDFELSVGMEGGLVLHNNLYHLVCAVSVRDKTGQVYTGVSRKVPIPVAVSEAVKSGRQLGEEILIFHESLSTDAPKKTRMLVEELISRKKSFTEAINLALSKSPHRTFLKRT